MEVLHVLGGVPRAGKSKLALRFTAQTGVPSFPTDAVVEAFHAVYPDGDIGHNVPRERRHPALEPALLAVIKSISGTYDNYLLEGVNFTPSVVHRLAEQHIDIHACFLGMTEPDLDSLLRHEGKNPWLSRMSHEYQQEFLARTVDRSLELQEGCREFGYSFVDVSVGSYEVQIERALEILMSRLKE